MDLFGVIIILNLHYSLHLDPRGSPNVSFWAKYSLCRKNPKILPFVHMKKLDTFHSSVHLNYEPCVRLEYATAGASPSSAVRWKALWHAHCGASSLALVKVSWVDHCGPVDWTSFLPPVLSCPGDGPWWLSGRLLLPSPPGQPEAGDQDVAHDPLPNDPLATTAVEDMWTFGHLGEPDQLNYETHSLRQGFQKIYINKSEPVVQLKKKLLSSTSGPSVFFSDKSIFQKVDKFLKYLGLTKTVNQIGIYVEQPVKISWKWTAVFFFLKCF